MIILGSGKIVGSLTIRIPQKIIRYFRVADKKFAKRLADELETFGEQTSVFDEAVGIWARHKEKVRVLI